MKNGKFWLAVMDADGESGVAIREHPVPNSDVRRQ